MPKSPRINISPRSDFDPLNPPPVPAFRPSQSPRNTNPSPFAQSSSNPPHVPPLSLSQLPRNVSPLPFDHQPPSPPYQPPLPHKPQAIRNISPSHFGFSGSSHSPQISVEKLPSTTSNSPTRKRAATLEALTDSAPVPSRRVPHFLSPRREAQNISLTDMSFYLQKESEEERKSIMDSQEALADNAPAPSKKVPHFLSSRKEAQNKSLPDMSFYLHMKSEVERKSRMDSQEALTDSAPAPSKKVPHFLSPRKEAQNKSLPDMSFYLCKEPEVERKSRMDSQHSILPHRRSTEGDVELPKPSTDESASSVSKRHVDFEQKKRMHRSRSMNTNIDHEEEWTEDLLPLGELDELDEDLTPSDLTPRNSRISRSPRASHTDSFYHLRISRSMAERMIPRIPEYGSSGEKSSRVVHESVIRQQMVYLPEISSIRFFKSNEAERELANCIKCFPGREQVIIQYLMEIRASLIKAHHIDRFDKVMALALLRQGNEEFICLYLTVAKIDVAEFTKKAVNEFFKKKDLGSLVLPAIMRITTVELQTQRRNELFRSDCLSSSLCKDFAYLVWKKELDHLRRDILKELKKCELPLLCLDQNMLKAQLREEDPDFGTIIIEAQMDKVLDMATSNVEHFNHFANRILPKIFSINVPKEISKMLTLRRALIMDFLKEHPANEERDLRDSTELSNEEGDLRDSMELSNEEGTLRDSSRPYIAEVVTLRILNPYICEIDNTPERRCVLVSLTKILQCCAKETPFGAEKSDSIYEMLNPLYFSYVDLYRSFIDQHSLPKSV